MGWCIGQTVSERDPVTHPSSPGKRRDAGLIALASVFPDLDSIGIIPELFTRGSGNELNWFSEYHHVIGHNLTAGLAATFLAALVASHRSRTALWFFLSFHIHLLCDIVGAKGPEGEQWPVTYLYPWSRDWQLVWSGQWEINALPNILLTIGLLFVFFLLVRKHGYSPLAYISKRADEAFVSTILARFPTKP